MPLTTAELKPGTASSVQQSLHSRNINIAHPLDPLSPDEVSPSLLFLCSLLILTLDPRYFPRCSRLLHRAFRRQSIQVHHFQHHSASQEGCPRLPQDPSRNRHPSRCRPIILHKARRNGCACPISTILSPSGANALLLYLCISSSSILFPGEAFLLSNHSILLTLHLCPK